MKSRNKENALPEIKPVYVKRFDDRKMKQMSKLTPSVLQISRTTLNLNNCDQMSNHSDGFEKISPEMHLSMKAVQMMRFLSAQEIRINRIEKTMLIIDRNLDKLHENIVTLVYQLDEINGQLIKG